MVECWCTNYVVVDILDSNFCGNEINECILCEMEIFNTFLSLLILRSSVKEIVCHKYITKYLVKGKRWRTAVLHSWLNINLLIEEQKLIFIFKGAELGI